MVPAGSAQHGMRRSACPLRAALGSAAVLFGALLVPLVAGWPGPPTGGALATKVAARPNIVFVLTDDLAMNLVTKQFMPNLWALEQRGAVFDNYFVTDSLCCPSRASIFTGRYPHDTGVHGNSGPNGGYESFQAHGDQLSTLATDLHAAGYRTAMMGKYLNRYHVTDPPAPGWGVWDVVDWGYPEFNYSMSQDGHAVTYGGPNEKGKDNYLTDVLSALADGFVTRAASTPARPFFLEVATFAPHEPYTPATRDAGLYPGLSYPKTPAYGAAVSNPPEWLAKQPPLTAARQRTIAQDFRLRAQSVKAVDDLIGKLLATLRATGQLQNTYVVFSSDNGLHMGEYQLMPGKLTAFDTDIHVPLVVVGPRVTAGSQVAAFAENIDLRSTFDALAGTHPSEPVDGRSLTPLLLAGGKHPAAPSGWRQGVLVEHYGPEPVDSPTDPDSPGPLSGNPPDYEALRLASALYVEYADGEHEYYDLRSDPYETRNVYGTLPLQLRAALHSEVVALQHCHNSPTCSLVRAPG